MKCSAGIAVAAVASAAVGALGLVAPATGKLETTRIAESPDITIRPAANLTIAPAPGTNGLYLHAPDGSVKGLMAEGDQAEFLDCRPSDNRYVLVRQTTHGHEGWDAYQGYVTAAATMAPGQLPCHL